MGADRGLVEIDPGSTVRLSSAVSPSRGITSRGRSTTVTVRSGSMRSPWTVQTMILALCRSFERGRTQTVIGKPVSSG